MKIKKPLFLLLVIAFAISNSAAQYINFLLINKMHIANRLYCSANEQVYITATLGLHTNAQRQPADAFG